MCKGKGRLSRCFCIQKHVLKYNISFSLPFPSDKQFVCLYFCYSYNFLKKLFFLNLPDFELNSLFVCLVNNNSNNKDNNNNSNNNKDSTLPEPYTAPRLPTYKPPKPPNYHPALPSKPSAIPLPTSKPPLPLPATKPPLPPPHPRRQTLRAKIMLNQTIAVACNE